MDWKREYFNAMFPFDDRVMELPYFIKGRLSNREILDNLVPDRRKPNIKLAEELLKKNLPQRLYKYKGIDDNGYSIDNFENDTLWLSHPISFNDPFDSIARNDTSVLVELYNELVDAKIITEENAEFLKELSWHVCISRPQRSFLVGCLSERNDSVLMWSHYADSHKGFCIGYDANEIYESNIIRKDIYPVLYYDLDQIPFEDSAIGLDYSGLYSVLRKSRQWSYEQEWRIVFSYFRNMGVGNIQLPKAKSVYLGVNITDENKKCIIEIGKKKGIEIFESELNIFDGTIQFKKISY